MPAMVETKSSGDLIACMTQEGVRLSFPRVDLGPYPLRPVQTSQCQVACPLGTDVKGYVGLIAAGEFQKALELIRETNPFPAICGRICLHPCEPECRRGEVDRPVAIRALKRFVADAELRQHPPQARPKARGGHRVGRVAVIGSGPAGLTAAWDLVRGGMDVTVFEALPVAGGMLSVGIAPFRLPREIIAAEIAAIAAEGVRIRTGRLIRDPQRLLGRGFDAVFMATGAHRGLKLGIPGEGLRGCVDALSYLRQAHLGRPQKPGRRAVVVGAGYAALDASRTALRLGWRQVDVVYRRSRGELPYPGLAAQAEREGVRIHAHLEPIRIRGRRGRVTGVVCAQVRPGPVDGVGRRQPLPAEGETIVLEADALICGIHQEPDLSFLSPGHGFDISAMNTLVVDPGTLATSHRGIFAGGDAVSGPKSVIEAMAMGHQAAASIVRFLGGDAQDENWAQQREQWQVCIDDHVPPQRRRLPTSRISPGSWKGHFQEVVQAPSAEQAAAEARRCLMCGPCDECQRCQADCQQKLLLLSASETSSEDVLVRIPWVAERFPPGNGPWEVVIDRPAGTSLRAMAWPVVCHVQEQLCRGCARCVEACPYEARKMVSRGPQVVISQVDQSICRGCGACVTVCPTGASRVSRLSGHDVATSLEMLLRPIEGQAKKGVAGEPRVVVMACHWSGCAHLVESLMPAVTNLSVLQVMCLGSINSGLILRAFELGADGVLLLGCTVDRCHYGGGAQVAGEELLVAQQLIHTLGIESRRLTLATVSRQHPDQVGPLVRRFARTIGRLGANPVRI